jgi:hypothetical protein
VDASRHSRRTLAAAKCQTLTGPGRADPEQAESGPKETHGEMRAADWGGARVASTRRWLTSTAAAER